MRVLVTSGPTYEPIDPVRFLGNRSSGRQGHAIAEAFRDAGADVTLITGPVSLPDPLGIKITHVQTAVEMLAAAEAALPVEVVVCAAAVADWRPAQPYPQKLKKTGESPPVLELIENPDILSTLSHHPHRPRLVIGFAAETERVEENASSKRRAKGCDWIVANDVSQGRGFDVEDNEVMLISEERKEKWPRMSKQEIARRLTEETKRYMTEKSTC